MPSASGKRTISEHRIFPRSDGVRPQRLAEPLLSGGAVQSGQYVLHAQRPCGPEIRRGGLPAGLGVGYDYLAFGGAVISAYMHYMLGDQDRALEYILGRFPTPINSATTPSFTAFTPISSMRRATMRAPNAITQWRSNHIDEKVVTAAVMTYLSYGIPERPGHCAREIPVLQQGRPDSRATTTPCTAISFTCRISRPGAPRWAATARRWTISKELP